MVVVKSSRKGKEREREREERPVKPAEPRAVPTHQTWVETSHGKPGCGKPGWALTFTSLVNSDVDDKNDTDGQEVNETPCKRCEKLKIQCLVQPEPKKLTSKDKRTVMRNCLACIECCDSKNRCELASKRPRSPSP